MPPPMGHASGWLVLVGREKHRARTSKGMSKLLAGGIPVGTAGFRHWHPTRNEAALLEVSGMLE